MMRRAEASASSRCASTAETIAHGSPIAGMKKNQRRDVMPLSGIPRMR
jgi:hypothetical protein